ncbi:MAG: hypothetical protein K9J30_08935 [Bacteroidales bacterium]|nr:hypothetical protein [Bacteroidales bacterium]
MLNELIFFLRYFPENIIFVIGDFEFNGLRHRHSRKFQWTGRKSRQQYMDALGERETNEAYREFLYWNREWTLESIHIRFSWALVFQVIACMLLIPVIIILAMQALLPAAVFLMISIGSYSMYLLLRRKVAKLHFQMNFVRMLIESVMEQGNE